MPRQYSIEIRIVPKNILSDVKFKSAKEARTYIKKTGRESTFTVVRVLQNKSPIVQCSKCNFNMKREYKFCPKCGHEQKQ